MSTGLSRLSRLPIRPKATPAAASHRPIAYPGAAPSRCFSRLPSSAPVEEIIRKFKDDGCVVMESMFTPSQIARLNADFDSSMAGVPAGRPANVNTTPLPGGIDAAVFGQNTKRIGNLPNSSPAFRQEVVDNEALHAVSAQIFKETGDYWLSTAQMIEIGPGSKAQPLHADAAGWWPFWAMGSKWTPEFAVNFLMATTDTTVDNGATGVVRDSHKINYADVMDDATMSFWNYPDDKVDQVELRAGDCLLLGGRIVHRGEENKTSDEFRRILSCTVISSALTPEEAYPLLLEEHMVSGLSERAKKFLGLRDLATTIGPDVWQSHAEGGLKKALGY